MAEELNVSIYDEKSGYLGRVRHDFVLPTELTVTITLNEYRELVKESSEAKKREAESDRLKLQLEVDRLKKENELLKNLCKKEEPNESV